MGFVLSVLYLVIHFLTPAYLLGPLADMHVEVIVAALAVLFSVPALMRSFILKNPQGLAMFGLAVAVFLSLVFGKHWLGGGERALLAFLPNAMAYFLVCLQCTSKKKLQVLVLMLFTVCLIDITQGFSDLRHGVAENGPAPEREIGKDFEQGETASPYLLKQTTESGITNYRLQGLGEINDPNDFGQLIVCVIPLMFIFWREKKMITNVPFVILPVALLLFGLFLTHSRGALVALTVLTMFAARRRIGTLPAIFGAGALFAAAMALHFTGGRDISATAGEDRTNLWGQGIQILKNHPLFGVGYGDLWEYTDAHLTAHNSVIVCAGELGLFGLFFWSLFLLPTLRDALTIASPKLVSEGVPLVAEQSPFPQPVRTVEELDKVEINRLGSLMLLSLLGYLTAGWFLSRAFVVTLFLLGGMAEAIYQMALRRGMVSPRMKLARVLPYSGGLAISLVLLMYLMVRILNLMH